VVRSRHCVSDTSLGVSICDVLAYAACLDERRRSKFFLAQTSAHLSTSIATRPIYLGFFMFTLSLSRPVPALHVIAAACGLACVQALAADDPNAPQRVEITGSNIKRIAKEGSSPIDTLGAAEIKATGAKTVLELMKLVPALGTDGFNDTPSQNGFSRGVATASLRSLSSTSTLILLNGRRMTPSAYANPNNGTSTLYDLNSIPLSAIARVEIFKDGASAVYGSDAVGGVINFITKVDYQGLEFGATIGANDKREFAKRSVNFSAGFGDLAADGYNVLLSADLTQRGRTTIRNGSDDIAAEDYLAINLRLNPFNSSLSSQPFYTKETSRGSLSFPQTGAAARVINRTDCDPSRLITGSAFYGNTTAPLLGRLFCNFDLDQFTEAQNKGTDASLISRGTMTLGKTMTGFAEIAFSKSDRTYLAAPRTTSGLSPTTNFIVGGLGVPFQAILEVGHPDNPFNSDPTPGRAAVGIRFENTPGGNELTNTQYRGLVGVRGAQDAWDWESALLWNRTERDETSYGFLRLPVLRQMLGSPGPTSGRSLASIAADPNLSRPLTNRANAQIIQWDAKVSSEFGALPGGPIGFAAGVELRRESIGIDPDSANANGEILGLATTAVTGKRDVQSAFVEFRAPILKSLEMDFAGRVDKYPGIKANFVPKVGAKWTVSPEVALRGTYSEGFRAPAVSQVSPGGAQFFLNGLIDPLRCEDDGTTPKPGAQPSDCAKSVSGVGGANPALKPETSKSHSLGLILSPVKGLDMLFDYYNIRKEGEVALGSAEDVINNPGRYPPGALTRDTNPALLLNGVAGTGPLLAVQTPWTNQGSTEVTGVDFEVKASTTVDSVGKWTNALRGAYILKYSRQEQPQYPENNLVGTNGGLSDWATTAPDIPRWKMRFTTSLEVGTHELTGAFNYTSGVSFIRRTDGSKTPPAVFSGTTCHFGGPNNDDPALLTGRSVLGVAPTATNGRDLYINRYPGCAVASWETFDVGYTYTGFKDLRIGLNVTNVLDQKAPYYPGTNTSTTVVQGYNAGLHSNTGRYFTLSLNYTFR
jgi:iron complex outermembrane recepter protein